MMAQHARTKGAAAPTTEEEDGRRNLPWPRVLLVCVCAFGVWLLLFAPTLQHNAQVSPVGSRRTVALDLLGPIAATSRALQLSRIVSETDAATGRTGNRPGNGVTLTLGGGSHHRSGHGAGGPANGTGTTVPAGGSGSSVPTTTAVDARHPTAANHLRVLITGDSLGLDLGGPLQNDMANTGVITATLDGHESTGLTRPDYYNWPAELQADLTTYHPQVVVIMIGANDPQDFPGPPDVPFTSPSWNTMYAARVAQFMQIAGSGGAQVIWVGMPPMQNSALSAKMMDLDTIVQQQAALQKPPVTFISSWTMLGTAQGAYTAYITSASGQVVNVRTPDGTHLTPAGGEVLSQAVLATLRTNLHYVLP
jgi:lysophospholipase L1-like esterase